MRKGSDLIGKPIVAFGTGEQIDKVQDLIFDQNSNQLLGFLVDEGGWFSTARVLPLQSIQAIGQDAIIVPSNEAVVPAETVPSVQRILENNNVLRGTKIMTTDGRDLGTMADLYFDEKTGQVQGYEASGGLFADAYSGRSFVPAPQTLKIGQDVAFVPPETADMMEEQVGGIKGAAQTAGEKISDASTTVGEKLQDATTAVTNRVVDPSEQREFVLGKTVDDDVSAPDGTLLVTKGEAVTPLVVEEAERQGMLDRLYRAAGGSVVGKAVSGAVAGTSVEQAQGRRVQRAVRSGEGMIIAAPGQIVTEQVINRARTFNKEAELLDAVGMSATQAAGSGIGATASQASDRIGAAASTAGDRISETAGTAKEKATGLFASLKEKVSELQERSSQELEEQRTNRALGRPVDRVILDRQDNVILNVGELITHKAVDEARQAGVLEILLGSVYTKEPEISQEEMRAPEPGDAALPR